MWVEKESGGWICSREQQISLRFKCSQTEEVNAHIQTRRGYRGIVNCNRRNHCVIYLDGLREYDLWFPVVHIDRVR